MREPKPFFRSQTKSWYVQFGKQQVPLGPNEKKAWEKYHDLMAERRKGVVTADDALATVLNGTSPGSGTIGPRPLSRRSSATFAPSAATWGRSSR